MRKGLRLNRKIIEIVFQMRLAKQVNFDTLVKGLIAEAYTLKRYHRQRLIRKIIKTLL